MSRSRLISTLCIVALIGFVGGCDDDDDFTPPTEAQLVTAATFQAQPGDIEEGRELIATIVRWRKDHQPPAKYNAGSVFRNPPGDSAGRIIDSLGLKGFSVGGVRVSEKHANFFVAEPDATAIDLHQLVERIADIVDEKTGIRLRPEIQVVGDFL